MILANCPGSATLFDGGADMLQKWFEVWTSDGLLGKMSALVSDVDSARALARQLAGKSKRVWFRPMRTSKRSK